MLDYYNHLPPFLRYLVLGTLGALTLFLLHGLLPKKHQRSFDAPLLVRYLALGAIIARATYVVMHHREVLQV